jgi:hypothetical protein
LRYFFFFSFSPDSRTLAGDLLQYDLASVSVNRTSTMQLVPLAQKPRRSRSPRSLSSETSFSLFDFESIPVVGQVMVFSVTQPGLIRGSLRTVLQRASWLFLPCGLTHLRSRYGERSQDHPSYSRESMLKGEGSITRTHHM